MRYEPLSNPLAFGSCQELVLCGLFLASRKIAPGINHVKTIIAEENDDPAKVDCISRSPAQTPTPPLAPHTHSHTAPRSPQHALAHTLASPHTHFIRVTQVKKRVESDKKMFGGQEVRATSFRCDQRSVP